MRVRSQKISHLAVFLQNFSCLVDPKQGSGLEVYQIGLDKTCRTEPHYFCIFLMQTTKFPAAISGSFRHSYDVREMVLIFEGCQKRTFLAFWGFHLKILAKEIQPTWIIDFYLLVFGCQSGPSQLPEGAPPHPLDNPQGAGEVQPASFPLPEPFSSRQRP